MNDVMVTGSFQADVTSLVASGHITLANWGQWVVHARCVLTLDLDLALCSLVDAFLQVISVPFTNV